MPINILMPALSPTMEEGTLAKWLVKEGDAVASGDVIAEIETDKATMEVEAVDEGTIGKLYVDEGTAEVKVNAVIAVLLEEGEDASSVPNAPSDDLPAESGSPDSLTAASQEALAEPQGYGRELKGAPETDAPSDSKLADAAAGDGDRSVGHGKHDEGAGDGKRVFASPLARRMASQEGLSLEHIDGSGPRGRVVKRDVEEALKAGTGKAPSAEASKEGAKKTDAAQAQASPKAAGPSDDAIRAMFEDGSYEAVPNDGMRKTIARRLTESKQTVPHFYLSVDCHIDALLALRKQINDAAPVVDEKPAYKVSVNDFVIKAMAAALMRVPAANASWTDSATLRHKHADVGVAVAVEGGLFTPIIRKAETKTLSTISGEMKDLAKRARDRKLKPAEYQGGTTSVSNLGMFGIKDFSAVINPPHGTILAVGAGEKRAVVEGDAIVAATIMTATLSCDHRVVDGALGAELLAAFKTCIEAPMTMLA